MIQWQLNLAAKTIQAGGIVAYPTESVYGLGCDAANLKAISRLLQIKNRAESKGLIVLVSDIRQAEFLLAPLTRQQRSTINQSRDRATTWLIDKRDGISPLLTGKYQQLAVRLTTNPVAKQLCDLTGKPIISTSCNLTSKQTTTQVSRVRNKMMLKVDQVLSGRCGGQPPSKIINLQTGQIIRS